MTNFLDVDEESDFDKDGVLINDKLKEGRESMRKAILNPDPRDNQRSSLYGMNVEQTRALSGSYLTDEERKELLNKEGDKSRDKSTESETEKQKEIEDAKKEAEKANAGEKNKKELGDGSGTDGNSTAGQDGTAKTRVDATSSETDGVMASNASDANMPASKGNQSVTGNTGANASTSNTSSTSGTTGNTGGSTT